MTKQEFLTHVGQVAREMNTAREFPELDPAKINTFAKFGLPGHDFNKDELVVFETPSRTYTYGILSVPVYIWWRSKRMDGPDS